MIIDTINANGYWWYNIRATATTVYKFTVLGTPAGYVKTCPASGVITYSYTPTASAITNQNFGFNCSSSVAYDYALYYARALRGSGSAGASYIYVIAANNTCHAGTGTVTLQVSPKYSIISSGITPTPASVSGNTVTWTIANMSDGALTTLYVPLTPLSTTHNGDTACNTANITTTGDVNLSNNVVGQCDSVRASWDPNEKSVSPDGNVSAGSTLTYTVNFENLGNDTAFNIHVQDTLSQYLDPNSFELLSATHKVIPYIYQIAGGMNVVKFDFPGINLESKLVPTRNKGEVRFTLKMKNGLPAGTVVANRAGIYFDGNPVVLTNSAYSKIGTPAGVNTLSHAAGIQAYPNPVADAITIRVQQDGWKEATLTNTLGQVVARISLATGENTLRVQALPAGIYYLQAKGSAGIFTEKVEKQ